MSEERYSVQDGEAEETLRLVAQTPPPDGLESRVHFRLNREMRNGEMRALPQRGIWGLWLPAHKLQFAGAAVLVLAMAASLWTVRHPKTAGPQAGSRSSPVAQPVPAPPGAGFGTAGAERHPASLTPIQVPPVPKKKPSAKRAVKAHSSTPTQSGAVTSAKP